MAANVFQIIPDQKPLVQCIHHSPGSVMTIVGKQTIDGATGGHVLSHRRAANTFGFGPLPLTTHDVGFCHDCLACDSVLVALVHEEPLAIVQGHHDTGVLKPEVGNG